MPKGKKGFQKGHKDFRTVEGIQQMARKISLISKGKPKINIRDEKHGNWKGDSVGYVSLHKWVRRKIAQPSNCPDCLTITNKLDLCNLNGLYDRELSNWGYKCRSCHKRYDLARANKLSGYKSHCPKGHEYNEQNMARHGTTGFVYCKACNRNRVNLYNQQKVKI